MSPFGAYLSHGFDGSKSRAGAGHVGIPAQIATGFPYPSGIDGQEVTILLIFDPGNGNLVSVVTMNGLGN